MKLRAKIKSKYFDEIANRTKKIEYRQFESIILTDELERKQEFKIVHIERLPPAQWRIIKINYPDISWKIEEDIYEIVLGNKIELR